MENFPEIGNLNIVVEMIFGSHLYGTNTENSDKDYKGVYLPSKKDILLNQIPKSLSFTTKSGCDNKNTCDDIDIEFYSLHYFIELACQGQTVAIDMLHAPQNCLLKTSGIWNKIVENRSKFYTRNLEAFVGYARTQAAKYGLKGSRLSDAKRVLDFLIEFDIFSKTIGNMEARLRDIWNDLPTGEHIHFLDPNPKSGLREYQICGRKFQETAKVSYVIPGIKKFYDEYGKRAKLAEANFGIDWKAVSHAIRAAYQIKSILMEGKIIFPLKESEFLKKVKNGDLHYIKEVSPILENLMEEIEELSKNSSLPEKVNRDFWNNFLIDVLENEYFK